ncbi:hypothetical protein N9L06_00425, partial [Mariniblastus sp.]|nr:hypothetical protein [Mariniblastus sp.]
MMKILIESETSRGFLHMRASDATSVLLSAGEANTSASNFERDNWETFEDYDREVCEKSDREFFATNVVTACSRRCQPTVLTSNRTAAPNGATARFHSAVAPFGASGFVGTVSPRLHRGLLAATANAAKYNATVGSNNAAEFDSTVGFGNVDRFNSEDEHSPSAGSSTFKGFASRKPKQNRAYTLLEVLLALGLTVVIFSMIAAGIRLHLVSIAQQQLKIEHRQIARNLLATIGTDIRSAVLYRATDYSGLENIRATELKQSSSSGITVDQLISDPTAAAEAANEEIDPDAEIEELIQEEDVSYRPVLRGSNRSIQFDISRL